MTGPSMHPGDKSAAELEREVEAQRANVSDTLDSLQQRLSPGQLVDQVADYVRNGGGADFARNMGRSLRDNPLPVALVGVGLAWLMASGNRPPRRYEPAEDEDIYGGARHDPYLRSGYDWPESSVRDDGLAPGWPAEPSHGSGRWSGNGDEPGMTERAGAMASAAGERAGQAASSVGETIGDAAQRVGEAASDAASRVGHAAGEVAHKVGDAVGYAGRAARRAGSQMRDYGGNSRHMAGRYGRRAQRGLAELVEEQPLMVGALGLALGAALGALLPATRHEDQLMGETRDQLKREATQVVREEAQTVRATAEAAYEAASEEANRQGLTEADAAAGARTLGDKLGKVASAARTAAEKEAERSSQTTSADPQPV